MNKKALGKGLSALIPDQLLAQSTKSELEDRVIYLKTEQILPNPFQPRLDFNLERQNELIASIKERGFLQPLLVRKTEIGFQLIAGERRLRAAKALNLPEVPVLIKKVKDEEVMVISLIENIQRQELNPIEEAQAFQRLIDEFQFTQDYVAQSVGKGRATVSNILRLLKLPQEIQQSISQGTITMSHARALLGLEHISEQLKLFQDIISNQLSVREIENLVKTKTKRHKRRLTSPLAKKDPYVQEAEQELQQILATKVRICPLRKRGKIVIDFYSAEDLERILEIIKK
ncbi:MAG: ParB/RepB/Spo0J family partition protein [Candidatus Omnitrophota bacterium]|nr:ParB/RepB/Spo0J family partition protein [Candidatus Omnitrophota bacterium]